MDHSEKLLMLTEIPPWEWPDSAAEDIMAILEDRTAPAKQRAEAATFGGEILVMDDDMAELLIGIVANAEEPEEVRADAAIALGPVLEQTDTEEAFVDDDYDEPTIDQDTFEDLKNKLRLVYEDTNAPKLVRRRALEAGVRAQEEWQKDAIREAWASSDRDWKLTAVFGMAHIRGFDAEILEALKSSDEELLYEAIRAAGNFEVKEAWPQIQAIIRSRTKKPMRLVAIGAAATLCPRSELELLHDLADSEDEDIAEAAEEALMMAQAEWDGGDEDEEDEA
jgi:hypothetical protein